MVHHYSAPVGPSRFVDDCQAAGLADAEGVRGYDAMHLAAALVVCVNTFASSDGRLCAQAIL
jgi:predicted nucleic acid-binding protein